MFPHPLLVGCAPKVWKWRRDEWRKIRHRQSFLSISAPDSNEGTLGNSYLELGSRAWRLCLWFKLMLGLCLILQKAEKPWASQCFPRPDLWTSSISICWKHIEMQITRPCPKPPTLETRGGQDQSSGRLWWTGKFEKSVKSREASTGFIGAFILLMIGCK